MFEKGTETLGLNNFIRFPSGQLMKRSLLVATTLTKRQRFHPQQLLCHRIAGIFRGRKLLQIAENQIFAIKTFTNCGK